MIIANFAESPIVFGGIVIANAATFTDQITGEDKNQVFSEFFATMKSMPDFGAKLAMEYGKRSNEIGHLLVSSGVANKEEDVNTVMLTGFFHAYGPINDYFVF